jgi:hypothetical protein
MSPTRIGHFMVLYLLLMDLLQNKRKMCFDITADTNICLRVQKLSKQNVISTLFFVNA